jgi:hypothetical protein
MAIEPRYTLQQLIIIKILLEFPEITLVVEKIL